MYRTQPLSDSDRSSLDLSTVRATLKSFGFTGTEAEEMMAGASSPLRQDVDEPNSTSTYNSLTSPIRHHHSLGLNAIDRTPNSVIEKSPYEDKEKFCMSSSSSASSRREPKSLLTTMESPIREGRQVESRDAAVVGSESISSVDLVADARSHTSTRASNQQDCNLRMDVHFSQSRHSGIHRTAPHSSKGSTPSSATYANDLVERIVAAYENVPQCCNSTPPRHNSANCRKEINRRCVRRSDSCSRRQRFDDPQALSLWARASLNTKHGADPLRSFSGQKNERWQASRHTGTIITKDVATAGRRSYSASMASTAPQQPRPGANCVKTVSSYLSQGSYRMCVPSADKNRVSLGTEVLRSTEARYHVSSLPRERLNDRVKVFKAYSTFWDRDEAVKGVLRGRGNDAWAFRFAQQDCR